MQIKNFYDLEVWQEAHGLTLKIYKTTKTFPKEETFSITSQLRRSCSSISANIAEGFGRYHFKDKIKFYINARGSISETQNFLFLSQDLKYITKEDAEKLLSILEKLNRRLNSLINKTKSQIAKQ